MRLKQDTSDDDFYRALAMRASKETPGGYRAVARDAGVGANPDSGRVIIHNWVLGTKDKCGKYYKPALSTQNRENMLAYLRAMFLDDHPHMRHILRLEMKISWSRRHDPANVEPLLKLREYVLEDREGDVPWDSESQASWAVWNERFRSM